MRDLQRRRLLAGTAAMGVGGTAGCLGLFGGGDEPTESTDETAVSPTDGTIVPPTRNQILAARRGRVVPVTTTGEASPIDPTRTETPLGDAVRRIDNAGDKPGFGTILLPPGKVTEGAPLVPTQFIRIIGWGINTSLVEFVDRGSDGIRVEELKDGRFVTLDGFTLSGADSEERNGGSAIHFVNDTVNPKRFNMGSVGFREWIDPVVYFERGSPFGSVWNHLDFGFGLNDGREIVVGQEQGLLGTQIGIISAGNRTGDTVLTTDFSAARFHVGFLNIGGSAGRAMEIESTVNGHVSVGGINFETGVTTGEPAITLDGPASARIGYVRISEGTTVGAAVRLGRRNGNNVIGRIRSAGRVRRDEIEVTRQPVAPSFYFGTSDDFGTRLNSLNYNVVALGDMGTPNGGSLGQFTPQTYASSTAVSAGELGVVPDGDSATLVYRTDDGTVHRWSNDDG